MYKPWMISNVFSWIFINIFSFTRTRVGCRVQLSIGYFYILCLPPYGPSTSDFSWSKLQSVDPQSPELHPLLFVQHNLREYIHDFSNNKVGIKQYYCILCVNYYVQYCDITFGTAKRHLNYYVMFKQQGTLRSHGKKHNIELTVMSPLFQWPRYSPYLNKTSFK